MNPRLLRASERRDNGSRYFPGLGQLQPVKILHGRFGIELRCEGVARDGSPVYQSFPLPRFKAAAKRAIAELEACKANGTRTPAAAWWDAYQEREVDSPHMNRPCAAAGLKSYRYPLTRTSFCMIGAADDVDALREARRTRPGATMDQLQRWNGAAYEGVAA